MEPWAEDILGKIEVEVQGKGKFNLLEQLRKGAQARFPGKQFPSPPEKPPEKRKQCMHASEFAKVSYLSKHVNR